MSESFQTTRKVALERANHECAFCGVTNEQHEQDTGKGLDVHHVLPRSAGGSDKPQNLLAVCRGCHKTLEHSQGAAMKEMAEETGPQRAELENQIEELAERNGELHRFVSGLVDRVEELERRNRDSEYYSKLLSSLRARGEVVSRKFGTKTYTTNDSEKAREEYEEWGTVIRRLSLSVEKADIESDMESIRRELQSIEKWGYKDE